MTFLGELLGYNEYGNDIMGVNENEGDNCIACGRSALCHSPEQAAKCMGNMKPSKENPNHSIVELRDDVYEREE